MSEGWEGGVRLCVRVSIVSLINQKNGSIKRCIAAVQLLQHRSFIRHKVPPFMIVRQDSTLKSDAHNETEVEKQKRTKFSVVVDLPHSISTSFYFAGWQHWLETCGWINAEMPRTSIFVT